MNEFGIYELTPEDALPKPSISIQDSISIKPGTNVKRPFALTNSCNKWLFDVSEMSKEF